MCLSYPIPIRFTTAYCILKHPQEALEVVTETILNSWEQRKKNSHTELTHVFKTARNLALIKLRDRTKDDEFTNSLPKFISENAQLSRFCQLTRELSPVQAEVMCLRSMVRLSLDEISIVVDMGINNVQSILAVARKEIRSQIDPLGNKKAIAENEILKKYYNGNSTIKEEEQLRLFFSRDNVTKCTEPDCELFQLFLQIGKAEMPTEYAENLSVSLKEAQNKSWKKRVANLLKSEK